MKKNIFAQAMIAVALATSFPVTAQDRGYDRAQERREDRRDLRDAQRDARREMRDERRDARREARDDRRDRVQARRGAGPRHDLFRGQRLPAKFHNRYYVVDNWRSHRLSAPPRGHHWVQVGDDYVLTVIATGIIAAIVLGN